MRRSFTFLVILAACSSGKSDGVTGPTPVASVSLNVTATTVPVGQTLSLSVTLKDASGIALTGRTVTWTSSANNIATVSTAGLVTGVAAGQSTITAASEGKSAQTTITVTSGAGPDCTGITPLNVAVGEIHTLSAAERQTLCLAGGANGTEYLLIPFNSITDTTLAKLAVPVSATAFGTTAAVGAPALAANATVRAIGSIAGPARRLDHSFELRLRQREHDTFGAFLRSRRRGPAALRSVSPVPGGINPITGLPANPTVGTTVTMNANGNDFCTNPINRTSRVAAVSNNAIVVVDQSSPAGGFTDAEYLSIATTFDTLVFSLDTTAFGKPFDMDHNGRIVLFFTTAVNALTTNSSPGIVGGFFFSRDLFPRDSNAVVPFSCPSSNEGEMFYLPVVDPNGVFNKYYKSKDTLQTDIIATLAHEFQHLINASRRIYVTPQDVDFEEVWLNEGMSHIAEELLFYRVTGLGPKQDLGYATAATPARFGPLVSYQADNLERFGLEYLGATDTNSPYAENGDLATRGATWNLLRWALDQSPSAAGTYLRALVDAPTQGKPNFDQVFSGVGGLLAATRVEVITNFFDDSGIPVPSQYAFQSWNFRDFMPHFQGVSGYPLVPKKLLPGPAQAFSLVGGGAGYLRFRVNSGGVGAIAATSGGAAVPATIEMILIRTQ
ncbi:MAG: Ig-like domain-containing protein [Gemmatimonadales bacterium]